MLSFEADIDTTGLTETEIDMIAANTMDAVAEAARDEWIKLAEESGLTTTKEAYIEGIGAVESPSATERTITLDGWLPTALEEGVQPFDMKPGLLKGRSHVVVPMLYGKPGQTTIPALSPQTFAKVKNLQQGERFSTKLGKSKFEGLKKTSIGKGIGPVQDTFIKFRTVSVNSAPDSWIHPGFTALLLSEKVRQFIENNIDQIVEANP